MNNDPLVTSLIERAKPDLGDRKTLAIVALLAGLLTGGLLGLEIWGNERILHRNLDERATAAAQRIARIVSTTVWSIYQRSDERTYSDQLSVKILDAELFDTTIISAAVFGNFGHLMMARVRAPDGKVNTPKNMAGLAAYEDHLHSVRLPIREGQITIGQVELYYTSVQHERELVFSDIRTSLIYLLFYGIFISCLILLRRATLLHRQTELAYRALSDTQEQLIQSEKLASLGNLVAGIAHELNTPLGIAITATTMIGDQSVSVRKLIDRNELTKSALIDFCDDVTESTTMSHRNLMRAASLVANFKQISVDQQVDEKRVINLADYIEEVMSTLSIALNAQSCQFELTGDRTVSIETLPGSIAQLLTNLVTNALNHAFEPGDPALITMHIGSMNSDRVQLTVKDNGKGMAPAVLARVFEPFFTTRRGRGGTGLGMHIVYNLVKQNLQGHLVLESGQGVGTRLSIDLPLRLSPEDLPGGTFKSAPALL
ncbi:sensor histidine kinase [Reinekea sp.]|jgi:signal transduction histidine kinase|uniref:sensor histidine kinase n=1 Tax=Reinekea sp. TaxID=1970455 RepID=UPI002A80E350|nr:ATP-binding protein [Reinekea sp.]